MNIRNILDSKDYRLLINGTISDHELESRAIKRDQKLQERLEQLRENSSYQELKDVLKFFNKLTKE